MFKERICRVPPAVVAPTSCRSETSRVQAMGQQSSTCTAPPRSRSPRSRRCGERWCRWIRFRSQGKRRGCAPLSVSPTTARRRRVCRRSRLRCRCRRRRRWWWLRGGGYSFFLLFLLFLHLLLLLFLLLSSSKIKRHPLHRVFCCDVK
jgi:hypothetical protein